MDQYQLISRWIQGNIPGKILPWQIDLDTTNICNQACYYCNTEQFRTELPVYQTLDQYIKLIDINCNHDFKLQEQKYNIYSCEQFVAVCSLSVQGLKIWSDKMSKYKL